MTGSDPGRADPEPPVRVRDARPGDLAAVAEIHAQAAARTSATFDETGHPIAWWQKVLDESHPDLGHYLLVAVTAGDDVMGYIKSGEFRAKAAYRTTCETSVYIGEEHRGRGAGRALYRDLLNRLEAGPLRLVVAGVTQPNVTSNRLHHALGFEEVGTYTGVGYKFGRPWDVMWFQRSVHV